MMKSGGICEDQSREKIVDKFGFDSVYLSIFFLFLVCGLVQIWLGCVFFFQFSSVQVKSGASSKRGKHERGR